MASLLISNEATLVVEALEREVLLQNQGPYMMQVGLTPDLDQGTFLDVWQSLSFPPNTHVWARCPTAKPDRGSTLFWSETVGDLL